MGNHNGKSFGINTVFLTYIAIYVDEVFFFFVFHLGRSYLMSTIARFSSC
jgi:hypothetical protein